MTFADELINFRAKYDLTQRQLSEIIGTALSMIYRYEYGLSEPSLKNLVKFKNRMKEWERGIR